MDWINTLSNKPPKVPLDPAEFYCILALIGVLVIVGGIGAGLTIGLMSLDSTTLTILKRSGTPLQKLWANRIEPIRKNSHLLLVTLLLMNTVVNESLPVLFHIINLDGFLAVLLSTGLIVIFGEIIPQAVCSRYGLRIGAFFAIPIRVLMIIIYPLTWPIAKLLVSSTLRLISSGFGTRSRSRSSLQKGRAEGACRHPRAIREISR
jgi:CBS domain containing-hemolysin-like protein